MGKIASRGKDVRKANTHPYKGDGSRARLASVLMNHASHDDGIVLPDDEYDYDDDLLSDSQRVWKEYAEILQRGLRMGPLSKNDPAMQRLEHLVEKGSPSAKAAFHKISNDIKKGGELRMEHTKKHLMENGKQVRPASTIKSHKRSARTQPAAKSALKASSRRPFELRKRVRDLDSSVKKKLNFLSKFD